MKILLTRNISSIYSNVSINKAGYIQFKEKKIYVFNIVALDILTDNLDFLYQIYNAYVACIKNINCNYKIIRVNTNQELEDSIAYYQKRLENVKNANLKKAIFNYVIQLENLLSEQDYRYGQYYILVETTDRISEFIDSFKPMTDYGLIIKSVVDKNSLENVLKVLLLKGEC